MVPITLLATDALLQAWPHEYISFTLWSCLLEPPNVGSFSCNFLRYVI